MTSALPEDRIGASTDRAALRRTVTEAEEAGDGDRADLARERLAELGEEDEDAATEVDTDPTEHGRAARERTETDAMRIDAETRTNRY